MWARRGGRAAPNKVRKPQLSQLSRENKERQKRIIDSLSPPPATSTVMENQDRGPASPIRKEESPISPQPEMASLPETASSSLSPPPSSEPAETEPATARAWVGTLHQGALQLSSLLVKLKNRSKDLSPQIRADRIEIVKSFLRYLEYEVEMTPAIKERWFLDTVLALPEREDLKPTAPPFIAAECRRLLAKFNDENWGEDEDTGDGTPQTLALAIAPPTAPTTGTRSSPPPETADMRLPPPDHPIWGLKGIMHGLALKPGRSIFYTVDPRYVHKKRDAKVFGHNGFEPGAWWPFQKLAHFYGCHGAPVRGITGTASEGAYSIVTSGSSGYEDMDQDFGDKLFYSADNSHDNTDPNKIAFTSNWTKSLHKSKDTGRPVRVLRSSGGKKSFTPKVGIRYDGLYIVKKVLKVQNKHGGLYEQFVLERVPGQRSLDDINRKVPSPEQQAAFAQIKKGY